jgi:hypothetical protein
MELDVAETPGGALLEVLACHCGYDEPAPRVPLTRAEIRRRIAAVRAARAVPGAEQ